MNKLLCVIAFGVCLGTVAADDPKPMTWADLVNHPERWPLTSKMTASLKFQGGKIDAGTEVRIKKVQPRDVLVLTPQGDALMLSPEHTDLVAAANAYMKTLTPEQREVTLKTLEKDVTLRPMKVTMHISLSSGKEKAAVGSELGLQSVLPGDSVHVVGKEINFKVDAMETDVLRRARELRMMPEEQRPGRIPALLTGVTVDPDGKPVEVKPAMYYLFYGSSATCGRCEIYTPKFVERYKKSLAGRSEVAVISLSNQETQNALKYAHDKGMTWPIIAWERRPLELNEYHVPLMPGMAVVDRFGRILATNAPGFPELEKIDTVLDKLDELLKKALENAPK